MVRRLVDSFKFAAEGIIYCVKSQRNMKFHLCAALIVCILGWWQNLTHEKIALLIFAVSLVIVTEMLNTAIETVVNMISLEFSPLAKIAKDVAAGAVLVAALVSLFIGYLVFFL